MRTTILITALAFQLAVAPRAMCQVPHVIHHQGVLLDSLEQLLDTTVVMEFRLFDAATGGTQTWGETQTVSVNSGLFSVLLGAVVSLPDSIFQDTSLWLETVVAGEELAARVPLAAVPFAFRAASSRLSDTATFAHSGAGSGWSHNASAVTLFNTDDSVGIGIANPKEKVQISGGRLLMGDQVNAKVGLHPGDILFDVVNIDKPGLKFYWANNKNFGIDLFTNPTGILRFVEDLDEATGVERMVIRTGGNVGIGTGTPSERLEVAGTISSTSGGFKFPDGTMQSTASNPLRTLWVLPQYVAGPGTLMHANVNVPWGTSRFEDSSSSQESAFSFPLPSTFVSISKIVLVVMSSGSSGALRYRVDTRWAANGEAQIAHSGAIPPTSRAMTFDLLDEVDVSAALTGAGAGNYVGLKFFRLGSDPLDTINSLDILGVLMEYY